MAFETDLVLRHKDHEDDWELTQPLRYRESSGRLIVVRAGYRTDLASVPRMARMIVNPAHPQVRRPAVIHDFIYTDLTELFTKAEADALFRASLREEGLAAHLAWLMWMAVRVVGRGNWRR